MKKVLPIVAVLGLVGLVPVLTGCASASAKSRSKDAPALNVPPPPPRIIEPAPEPLPEPVAELPAPPSNSTPPPRPRPRDARPVQDTKPEQKPAEPATPDPGPVAQPPLAPAAQLQTPQTADISNAARGVRATIDRANGLLGAVNYGPLSNVRKKAYDDAKRFIQEAEDALKKGNLVFAQGVANKAETLARELAGR